MMIPLDEHSPTHRPAVTCAICQGDDELVYRNGVFVCRGRHTGHTKIPIPFPGRLRLRKVSDRVVSEAARAARKDQRW